MISIDHRAGSKELSKYFGGNEAEVTELDYGDFAFPGSGPSGPVLVGVERKTIFDLLNSITSGRLGGHQLRGLLNTYHRVYLIVEGLWRGNPRDDVLEVWRSGGWTEVNKGRQVWTAGQVMRYLLTLDEMCGVRWMITKSPRETAGMIRHMEGWWKKDYREHKGHLVLKEAIHSGGRPGVHLAKPSLVQKVAAQFDKIGWDRSIEVAKRFRTVEEMVGAGVKEWMEIKGIGKGIAEKVVRAIKGGMT